MKKLVQRLFIAGISALVVLALVWSFLPKPVDVDVAKVTRGPMATTVDEDGVTRIRERYVVSSPVTGRLWRIGFKSGARVRAGETVVATIQPVVPQPLDVRTRTESEARASAAEAAVLRTEADEKRAEVALSQSRADLDRARELLESGVLSRRDFELAQTAERIGSEELRAAQFAGRIARFEAEQVLAALRQFTNDMDGSPEALEVKSPIDGQVLRVWQESESVVTSGAPLLEVGNPTDLEVVVDVLSADGVRIRPGAKMTIERWGGAEPLHAQVRLVEPAAFLKISALGVEEQRVNVIADLVEPPAGRPTLGDAFRVEARIVIWEAEDVVTVPTSALFRQGDRWEVFVVEAEHARLREVELGHQNGLSGEVVEGLEPGESVVLHPGDHVRDGIKVRVRRH